MALQIRRGTNANRANITPLSGELVFTTDTQQLYVGDGVTPGGILITGAGGNGTPGGANTQVQFNANGAFGGSNAFTFNSTSNTLTVTGNTVTTQLLVSQLANLGNVANVRLLGGTSGQVLITDGAGNLSFANLGNVSNANFNNNASSWLDGTGAWSAPTRLETITNSGFTLSSSIAAGTNSGSIAGNATGNIKGTAQILFAGDPAGAVVYTVQSSTFVSGQTNFVLTTNVSQTIPSGAAIQQPTLSPWTQIVAGTNTTMSVANGVLTVNATGGGGNATPGGSNTQIQFNSNGTFGGSSNLTWDGNKLIANTVFVPGLLSTQNGLETWDNANRIMTELNWDLTGPVHSGYLRIQSVDTGNANTSSGIGIGIPATPQFAASGGYFLTLPANVGSNGQVLTTDGTGNLSFTTPSGGNGVPGGANTEIQFNDGGVFGGNLNFTYNKVSNTLSTQNLDVPGIANLGPANTVFITGGANGQFLRTDGLGNLSFAQPSFIPGGSNTSIQYNANGNLNGSNTFTYDSVTDIVTANNLSVTGLTSLGSNGQVTITGGTSGQVLTTDGFGNLSWTTVTGGNGGGGGGGAIIFSSAAWQPNSGPASDAYYWNGSASVVNQKSINTAFVAAFTPSNVDAISINGVSVSVANIVLPGTSSGTFTIPAVNIPSNVQTTSGPLQMIVTMSNSTSNTTQLGSATLTPQLLQPIAFSETGTITATPVNPPTQPYWLANSTGNITASGISLNAGSTLANAVLTLRQGLSTIATVTETSLAPYQFTGVPVGANYTVTASLTGSGSHGANTAVTLPLQTSGAVSITQPTYTPLFTKFTANSTIPTFTTSDSYEPYQFTSGDTFTFTVDTQTGNYYWTAVPGLTSRIFIYNTGIGNATVTPDSSSTTTISGQAYTVYGFTNVAVGTVFTIE